MRAESGVRQLTQRSFEDMYPHLKHVSACQRCSIDTRSPGPSCRLLKAVVMGD
jgi:hypothetical protein